MARYTNPAIRELSEQQVRFAPRGVRLEQIERAERFVDRIDPAGIYRYGAICEEITQFRPERYPDLVLTGAEAVHDLRCFVEDVSGSIDLPVEHAGEMVLTIEDVSRRFDVSARTVDRWRDRGLISRRFLFGGRKRIGFLESTVERFARRHAEEVRRGTRTSRLTGDQREEIVRRARRLALAGGNRTEVSRRLAKWLGRSPETIRSTLKSYDRVHPESAVFPGMSGPLGEDERREVFRRYRQGTSVYELAARFGRTRSSIHRIIAETRAAILLERPIDFMHADEFLEETAEAEILGEPPETESAGKRAKPPPGLPAYLVALYELPLLTREQEGYYFRKMNFLRFQAAATREELDVARAPARLMDRIETLLEESLTVKNFLIRSNLRLVVSIAKRHAKPGGNFFELVSDGNMSLIRAIEKFDYTRGFKFSTYASWAIMKNYARSIPAEYVKLERYRTGQDEVFLASPDSGNNPFQDQVVNLQQREVIKDILEHLDPRERKVIQFRFGLGEQLEPETLEQVGRRFGVTKERIRQLEARALKKLRQVAVTQKLDIPGL